MANHPEFESERDYIAHAYDCLERMRSSAKQLQYSVETGPGGTHQARFERDVVEDQAMHRLSRLQLGNESLVFGRIDRMPEADGSAERFYIGRLPVADAEQSPVVVDWRAPVAEPFYRATGRNPLGLERRRHFATEGEKLLGIDDEVFSVDRLANDDGKSLVGTGALLAALGRARTGVMRDIVATIQSEQDEIIRTDLHGVLVVQGGPGTGKTAVALHRASYLLYTHRFPLERQGVLVVGPNRYFIRYIARVLPALGETGVDLLSVEDLFPDVSARARDSHPVARIKGDLRMAKFIRKAVATRQRGLRDGLTLGYGVLQLTITADESAELVNTVKRGHRQHNGSRKQLQTLLIERFYDHYRTAMARHGLTVVGEGVQSYEDFAPGIKRLEEFKLALDRMWPLLTAQSFLRDLFGAQALVKAAAAGILNDEEQKLLHRDRGDSVEDVAWTTSDVPLLDEAAQFLGPIPKPNVITHGDGKLVSHPLEDSTRTYGHIVIDEAQDLSPMQLRMVGRRSLSGSMTVVGDIGQATGMWAPNSWQQVLDHLPKKRPPRTVELTVGYRTPAEIMAVAARVLRVAAPALTVPTSVRSVGYLPSFVQASEGESVVDAVRRAVPQILRRIESGTLGVLCPDSLVDEISAALAADGITIDPTGTSSDAATVLPVRSSKGLEFDGVVVVEPAMVVDDSAQGLRALYVALTRATRALSVVHALPLPPCLDEDSDASHSADEAEASRVEADQANPVLLGDQSVDADVIGVPALTGEPVLSGESAPSSEPVALAEPDVPGEPAQLTMFQ